MKQRDFFSMSYFFFVSFLIVSGNALENMDLDVIKKDVFFI